MKLARILFLLILVIYSCNSDDNVNGTITPESEIPDSDLTENRVISINILTGSIEGKTWKITNAILANESGTFNITENFNIRDDEFLFSGSVTDGQLEWRQNHRINNNATTLEETLVDHFLAPENYSFSFDEESSSSLVSINGNFRFTITDENTITGRILLTQNTATPQELEITLNVKTATDFPSIPTNPLNFENVFTYYSCSIEDLAPGMIGSYSDNSLFIVNREDCFAENNNLPERVVKFNLSTNESSERLFFSSDFASKQLHILNNQIFVVGGRYINTYDLSLENEPNSISNGIENFCSEVTPLIGLSRYGMAVQNNDIYIIGGNLSNFNEETINSGCPIVANIIYKWNISTQTLTEFVSLPETTFGTRGTIVNDKLYVFGGQRYLFEGEIYDTIHIIDLNTTEINTQQLPSPIQFTYVDRFDSLIYIAGQNEIKDSNDNRIGFDFTLGVFDTQTNLYTTLETNLNQVTPFETIHSMCIFNDAMYILYGASNDNNNPDELDDWDIKRVNLN